MASSILQATQSYTTTPHKHTPPIAATATHLHLVISYTAEPYAAKGSVAANRVAADGHRLMTTQDKCYQLHKQASEQTSRGRGGKPGERKEKQAVCRH